jgi:hypothetical protein
VPNKKTVRIDSQHERLTNRNENARNGPTAKRNEKIPQLLMPIAQLHSQNKG